MRKKVEIVIAIGSNTNQDVTFFMAKRYLPQLIRDIKFTDELWTEPIGMESPPFLNCLAIGHTTHEPQRIQAALRSIENRCGDRKRTRQTRGEVKMDIDLLLYDGQRLHKEDWQRPYVKTLMKQIQELRKSYITNQTQQEL